MTPGSYGAGPEVGVRGSGMRSWRVWLGFGISFVFLFFAFNGPGPLSVDSALDERKRPMRA